MHLDDLDDLEDMFRELFLHNPMITGAPKLVSSEALFVDPTYFATLRV